MSAQKEPATAPRTQSVQIQMEDTRATAQQVTVVTAGPNAKVSWFIIIIPCVGENKYLIYYSVI